jgi:putative acetyltransferase
MTFLVRDEAASDAPGTAAMLTRVFGRPVESTLVERLRRRSEAVSVVAESTGEIVGHAIFHSVEVEGVPSAIRTFAVGLVAVERSCQSKGVGTRLVEFGLAKCKEAGIGLMFVLGPIGFYERFGFVSAPPRGFQCRWRIPEGLFFVLELASGALDGAHGTVSYPPEFD